MKYRKTIALLYVYDLLLLEKKIAKEDVMRKLELSEISFWRYIQDIRAFLAEFDPGKELIYHKGEGTYELINAKSEWM